jgi:hypothetical protein
VAHGGCMDRLSWPTAVGLTTVARLQPPWATAVRLQPSWGTTVRLRVWWSKLINFETVVYFLFELGWR